MKDDYAGKINLLTALVAVVIAALAAQTVVMIRMNQKMLKAGSIDAKPVQTHADNPSEQNRIAAGLDDDQTQSEHSPEASLEPDSFMTPAFPDTFDEWDPFKEMHAMHDRINQMFGSAFNRFQDSSDFSRFFDDHAFSPDIDIQEKTDAYIVTVDLPGIEDSKIDVNLKGQTLSISGSMQSESNEDDNGKIIRRERRSGNFERVLTLPGPVKADELKSKTEKGVLRIIIPKDSAKS
jgi:HSP20 family protein